MLQNNDRQERASSRTSGLTNFNDSLTQSQILNVGEQSFKAKYQRALQLIQNHNQISLRSAFQILINLCLEIQNKSQNIQNCSIQILQNIVMNCWRLMNLLKQSQHYQDSLHFIKSFVEIFKQIYSKRKIKKNRLSMLYLVQANDQYQRKLFNQALNSCKLSLTNCSSTRNHAQLLKIHYLQTKIFCALKQYAYEYEEIKKCLFNINNLQQNKSDPSLKQNINEIKKNLISRKINIEEDVQANNQSKQFVKDSSLKKQVSNKFRKRSISLKKQATKQSQQKVLSKKKQQSQVPSVKIQSLHISKSYNHSRSHSKLGTISTATRKYFMPLDINKDQKKLKKKPLKISTQNLFGQKKLQKQISDSVLDEIQFISPATSNHYEMMVVRPTQKQQTKKVQQQKQIAEMKDNDQALKKNKYSSKNDNIQETMIQPVTHNHNISIANPISNSQNNNLNSEKIDEFQDMVKGLVREAQDNILSLFIRRFQNPIWEEPQKKNTETNLYYEEEEIIDKIQLSLKECQSEKLIVQQFEDTIYKNQQLNINDEFSVCTAFGVLSRFVFQIKIQKNQYKTHEGVLFKNLQICFSCEVNFIYKMQTVLLFPFYNTSQKNIDMIIQEILDKQNYNKKVQDQLFESLNAKILRLIIYSITIIKKANGYILTKKSQNNILRNISNARYSNLKQPFLIYEQNRLSKNLIKFYSKQQNQTQSNRQVLGKQLHEKFTAFLSKKNQQKTYANCYNFVEDYFKTETKNIMKSSMKQSLRLSTTKKIKQDKVRKQTMYSFKSTLKSFNQSDFNTRLLIQQDAKSYSLLLLPSDLNLRIINYFQYSLDAIACSGQQFYFCMKFILAKPQNNDLDKLMASYFQNLSVKFMHRLKSGENAYLTFWCFQIKAIFNKKSDIFFKLDIQLRGKRTKKMKLIITSKDLCIILHSINKAKNSIKLSNLISMLKDKDSQKENLIKKINQCDMLNILQEISPFINIKKDYIYNTVGFQTDNPLFCYINKFKLEGKALESNNFLTPQLKIIRILLQKAIKIEYDIIKQYGVLSIIHIERTHQFNIAIYLPKLQKKYSVDLNQSIIHYIEPKDIDFIFAQMSGCSLHQKSQMMFGNSHSLPQIKKQRVMWNKFLQLIKFQFQFTDEKQYIVLKIGNYKAFLKDSSLTEYFQLKQAIYHLEISLQHKYNIVNGRSEIKRKKGFLGKRKSSSSKQLGNRNNNKDLIKTNYLKQQSTVKRHGECFNLKKSAIFQKINQILESQTSKYIIYVSLKQICRLSKDNRTDRNEKQIKKMVLPFNLSDLISLLKSNKQQIYNNVQQFEKQFNEQIFSYSVLLRAMNTMKYKILHELKSSDLQLLFSGDQIIKNQKILKNKLTKTFNLDKSNDYTLNNSKKLHFLEQNNFIINKSVMNLSKNALLSIFYNKKQGKIFFIITHTSELLTKKKDVIINKTLYPYLDLFNKDQFVKTNRRISNFYKNMLLLY